MSEYPIELPTGGFGPEVDITPGLPEGLGHVVNMAHLVQPPDGMAPANAKLVTDDVRILHNGWRIPGRLPVSATQARPVKRFTATFTPKHFTAEVEFAWRDLTPNPHAIFGEDWVPPSVDADGTVHTGSRPDPAGPYQGYVYVLATPDVDTVGVVPSFGHQIPNTATAFKWSNWGQSFNLTAMRRVNFETEFLSLSGPQYVFVTFYWTNEEGSTASGQGHDGLMLDQNGPRWSFPYTVPKYITG